MAVLNRKVDYAILVLYHLYQHPAGAAARTIAEQYGLSRGFVANILKELCHEGFVTSHRGVKGGYALAPNAIQLTLAELIETLDETFRLVECNHAGGANCAVFPTCMMKGPMTAVHNKIMSVLSGVTLGELFGASEDFSSFKLQVTNLRPETGVGGSESCNSQAVGCKSAPTALE